MCLLHTPGRFKISLFVPNEQICTLIHIIDLGVMPPQNDGTDIPHLFDTHNITNVHDFRPLYGVRLSVRRFQR